MMQDTKLASSPHPVDGFAVGPEVMMPLRGVLALRLVDLAMLVLRTTAILVLLSPVLILAALAM